MKQLGNISAYLLIITILIPICEVRGQNTNISDGYLFDGEPFITINPSNGSHMVVAWMGVNGLDLVQIMTRVSTDGGNSWSAEYAQPHIAGGYTSADPSMDWDSDGNLYLCYIDYSPFGTSGKTIVRKSADGGFTWGDPVEVIDAFDDPGEVPVDRPWLVIDRSGGLDDGFQYVTTKPAPWIPFPNRNYLTVSKNGGLSFEDWRYIDTTGWQIGDFIQAPMAAPAVGPDGTLHCVYPAWEPTENLLPRFIHASSVNGGDGFSYYEMLESFGGDLNADTSAKTGYQLLVDPTDPHHLVFLFVFRPLGDNDIYCLESANSGVNWSTPLRINADPAGNKVMQDLVWGDFDGEGNLVVTWRDRRNAVDTGYAVASEIWGAVRYKDSIAFSNDFRISSALAAFDSVLYGNGNDFMGVQLFNDTLYAVWGDTRNDYLNIWFSKQAVGSSTPTGVINLGSEQLFEITAYPNPAGNYLMVEGDNISRLQIRSASGQVYLDQSITTTGDIRLSLENIPAGNYFLAAFIGNDVAVRQIAITK
ncbi:MAG TPA: T9SS type A sorting domain-containing protein [Chitinophagales bacterium]|nr:T9SS type A sorting domain-containing protein [Chitinophagales bacterium]HNO28084.1 T9SS type A sorting domain-containing protein [Chitinophagales bacterium]